MDKKINKQTKDNQLSDLLEDLRCDLYAIISVGEFEGIEIDELFEKYKKLIYNDCKNMQQIRDWFHKKFGNLDIQKDLEDYQSLCNIIWTWERDRKDL